MARERGGAGEKNKMCKGEEMCEDVGDGSVIFWGGVLRLVKRAGDGMLGGFMSRKRRGQWLIANKLAAKPPATYVTTCVGPLHEHSQRNTPDSMKYLRTSFLRGPLFKTDNDQMS